MRIFKECGMGRLVTYGNWWAQVGGGLAFFLSGLFFCCLINYAMKANPPDPKWLAFLIPSIFMAVGGIMLIGTRRVVIDRKQGRIAVQWGLFGITLFTRTGSLGEVTQVTVRMDVASSGHGRMRKASATYVISLGPVDCYGSHSHIKVREQAQFLGQYLELPVHDSAPWFGKDLRR